MTLKIDNFDSEWLGRQPLTPAAEAIAELRGHGTLADLRQVLMADASGTLAAALAEAQPALAAGRDIETLREADARRRGPRNGVTGRHGTECPECFPSWSADLHVVWSRP